MLNVHAENYSVDVYCILYFYRDLKQILTNT